MEQFLETYWNQPTAVEQKVLFAEQLLQGVASATQDLLTIANYEKSIQSAMQALGKATQVDRIYIFRHDLHSENQQPLMSQSWEWVNDGVAPQINNLELQNLPFNEVCPRWYQEFLKGRSISGLVEEFPKKELEMLEPQEILSIVVVPIFVKSVFWGFMGFDDCHYGHDWSKSEVAVLKSVANSFGGAFMRHQVEQNLVKKNQELELKQIELQRAKVEAEKANETKNIFLAKVSHELRTPMNGILGYAQILERSNTLGAKEQHGVQVIYQCGNHLLKLINDLLDVARIESQKVKLSLDHVHIKSLVNEVLAVGQIDADSKGVEIISELSTDLPEVVLTDVKRLKQVLLNLIHNAIKFTEQGRIRLSVLSLPLEPDVRNLAEKNVCKLKFVVEDTGIGIAAENLEILFRAFEQIETSQCYSDGLGLGLSISQEIIQAMGSTINVKSELNVGSTFFFELNLPTVCLSIFSEQNNKVVFLEKDIDRDEPVSSLKSEREVEMILPESSLLNELKLLAQAGRLKKLIDVIETIEADRPECRRFTREITKLAKQFASEEIECYLNRALQNGV
jgi:two-component system, sensor histidine kinase and response regulator